MSEVIDSNVIEGHGDVPEAFHETLKNCEFESGANNARGYDECGDPASHRLSWDGCKTWLYLCPVHYRKVCDLENSP